MKMRWTLAMLASGLAITAANAAPAAGDARPRKLAESWVERLTSERLLDGYGTGRGKVRMDLLVTEAEYRAIAARRGWSPAPRTIEFSFSNGVTGEVLPAKVRPLVRIFAHRDRALRLTNQALLGGRIELRNGCLYVTDRNQPDRLAYFPREFGLTLDPQDRLAIRSRLSGGKIVGRIGEQFNWAGPIGISEDAPMVRELRAKCGNAPIEHVGMLVTQAEFRRRHRLD